MGGICKCPARTPPRPFWVDKGWLKPLLAFLAIFLYTVLIEPVGYLFATLVFMLLWQFAVENEKWLKGTLVSVISTVVMWLLLEPAALGVCRLLSLFRSASFFRG